MASQMLENIIAQARMLPIDEQFLLIARLAEVARQNSVDLPPRRAWRDIAGTATYPLAGEDAQDWISRLRREENYDKWNQCAC